MSRRLKDREFHIYDGWRRSPAHIGGQPGHKEWLHFCVLGDGFDFIANWSLSDELGPSGWRVEVPRLTVLAREASRGHSQWLGHAIECESGRTRLASGRVDCDFDGNSVRVQDGSYHLLSELADAGISCQLDLRALCRPALSQSVMLGEASAMRWAVVPRLLANGWIQLGERRIVVSDQPAYHDHNWGAFSWGGDFSWEWASILPPDSEWSLVYMRMLDAGRHRTASQGLLLWRNGTFCRAFRDFDVDVRTEGRFRGPRPRRVPGILGAIVGGSACDLPERLLVRCQRGTESLSIEIELLERAEIVLPPSSLEGGGTLLSEVRAAASVQGNVDGSSLDFEAAVSLEWNHAWR